MRLETRFVYNPDADYPTEVKKIQQWSWNWTLGESPVLQISTPDNFFNATDPQDLAMQINWGAGWFERPGMRFVIADESRDPFDASGVRSLTCVGVDYDLTGQFAGGNSLSDPTSVYTGKEREAWKKIFTSKNPGAILTTALGYVSGNLSSLTWDFTSTKDSDGNNWPTASIQPLLEWQSDDSIHDLLDAIYETGVIDWRCEKNKFRVFAITGDIGTGSTDRTAEGLNRVELLFGKDISAAPQQRSRRDIVYGGIIIGENGRPYRVSQSGTTTHRGRRYVAIDGSGVKTQAVANAIGNPLVARLTTPSIDRMVRDLILDDDTRFIPMHHYNVGDRIIIPGADGKRASGRVVGITLTGDPKGRTTGNVQIDNVEKLDKYGRQIKAVKGSTKASAARAASPALAAAEAFVDTLRATTLTNFNADLTSGTSLALTGKNDAFGSAALNLGADATGGRVWSPTVYARTYSDTPNMVVTSAGTLGRSTSATKYKVDIQTVDYGDAVLDLPVKTWFDKTTCDAWADALDSADGDEVEAASAAGDIPIIRRIPGLIAEDVVAAGLTDFVAYGADGTTVEGLNYDRLLVTLIPIIKSQRDTIAQLSERVTALEGT